MKNKNIFFIFMLSAFLTNSISSIDSHNMPTVDHVAPMNIYDQARLDYITEKLNYIDHKMNAFNHVQYKGYVTPIANKQALIKNDKVFVDETWFKSASTQEIDFVLGQIIAHKKICSISRISEISTSYYTHAIGSTIIGGISGALLSTSLTHILNSPPILQKKLLGLLTVLGASTGLLISLEELDKYKQSVYAADTITVTKFNCHNAAIEILKKSPETTPDTHPSHQERINHIKELPKK